MTAALTYHTTTLTPIDCNQCGVTFGMPDTMERARRKDHGTFYCPNGHSLFFSGKNLEERERERRIAAEAKAARMEDRAEVAERRRRAAVGQVTKVKNRIKSGVCPFCRRSFTNVRDHMASQHHDSAKAKA